MSLTEGDRRLVYFYSHGNSVVCPECAETLLAQAPGEAERMEAHYSADGLLRCSSCLIWIGPDEG